MLIQPAMERASDVLVLPYASAWVGGPDPARIPAFGRVYREGRGYTDLWPDADVEGLTKSAPRVAEPFLYGGPFKNHFGHALTDSILRLYAFDRARHKGVVFAALVGTTEPLPRYFLDMVSLFGIEPDEIHLVQEPTMFAALDVAEPGSVLGGGPREWYLPKLEQVAERLHQKRNGRTLATPSRISLGRAHMLHKGTLMGESYFASLLAQQGFVDVRPETFDLFDQLAMLEAAEEIVFTEGSAIYSAELLPRLKARIYMLPRRGKNELFEPHLRRAASFTMLGGPLNCWRLPGRSGRNAPNSPSYARRPKRIHADMVKHGLAPAEPFDLARFQTRERRDAARYFGDRRGDLQIGEVRDRRRQLRAEKGSPDARTPAIVQKGDT